MIEYILYVSALLIFLNLSFSYKDKKLGFIIAFSIITLIAVIDIETDRIIESIQAIQYVREE